MVGRIFNVILNRTQVNIWTIWLQLELHCVARVQGRAAGKVKRRPLHLLTVPQDCSHSRPTGYGPFDRRRATQLWVFLIGNAYLLFQRKIRKQVNSGSFSFTCATVLYCMVVYYKVNLIYCAIIVIMFQGIFQIHMLCFISQLKFLKHMDCLGTLLTLILFKSVNGQILVFPWYPTLFNGRPSHWTKELCEWWEIWTAHFN